MVKFEVFKNWLMIRNIKKGNSSINYSFFMANVCVYYVQ